jgi:hypothetical protein
MKGGAGKPYTCEGVPLIVGNPLIQIAVTQEDDGTYSFNVPGTTEPFKNYCELFQYYQANVPLACVKPLFINSAKTQLVVPSLVQILGLALILLNINANTVFRHSTIKLGTIGRCITALYGTVNEPLFTATSDGCVVSESFKVKLTAAFTKEEVQVPPFSFYKVNNLSDQEVETILKYFKMAMFYYKFNAIPDNNPSGLTFAKILNPEPTKIEISPFLIDNSKIEQTISSDPFQLYKKSFYLSKSLAAGIGASAAAPTVSVASPVEDKGTDARLAALETAVASIQQSVAAIQAKLA